MKNNGANNLDQQTQNKESCFVCNKSGNIALFCIVQKCGPNPKKNVTKETFMTIIIDINMVESVDGWRVLTVIYVMTKTNLKNILILRSPKSLLLVILIKM